MESSYDLELTKLFKEIRENNPKRICIQLPDGLKPRAEEIVSAVNAEFKDSSPQVFIWLGSNFGACDLPIGLQTIHIDMLIMWGHNQFNKVQEGWDI